MGKGYKPLSFFYLITNVIVVVFELRLFNNLFFFLLSFCWSLSLTFEMSSS